MTLFSTSNWMSSKALLFYHYSWGPISDLFNWYPKVLQQSSFKQIIYVKLESWIQLKNFTSIEMFISIEKVPFNWNKSVQLKSLQFNFSSEFSWSHFNSTFQVSSVVIVCQQKVKKNILLLMFFRKLGQKVCEGGQFESNVNFN